MKPTHDPVKPPHRAAPRRTRTLLAAGLAALLLAGTGCSSKADSAKSGGEGAGGIKTGPGVTDKTIRLARVWLGSFDPLVEYGTAVRAVLNRTHHERGWLYGFRYRLRFPAVWDPVEGL
ncbi:hypothetical protein [Streptomyces nigra]